MTAIHSCFSVRVASYDQNHDALIVGGEDHKSGFSILLHTVVKYLHSNFAGQKHDFEERCMSLLRWTKERFPVEATDELLAKVTP